MFLLIIMLIVIVMATWIGAQDGDFFGGLFVGFIFATVVFMVVTLLAQIDSRTDTFAERDLASINDGTSTTGAFFLGSGSIDSEPTYTYYVQDGNAKLFESSPAKNVRVFEGSGRAYLKERTDCRLNHLDWLAPCLTYQEVVEIHVPSGTIKQNYVLDAK